jgi:hypothetical protein
MGIFRDLGTNQIPHVVGKRIQKFVIKKPCVEIILGNYIVRWHLSSFNKKIYGTTISLGRYAISPARFVLTIIIT